MALYSTLQKFITKEGAPVEGASVNVKLSGGTVDAELFATRTGAFKSNPFLTTENGEALCYVKAGRYDMTVTKGIDQVVFKDIEVGPVSNVGTFAEGGTITDPDQLIEDAEGNKWRWTGNLNYTFAAGENPESNPEWVKYIGGKYASIIALLEQWGYSYKGTFAKGFTYSQEKDAGIDENGKAWIYVGAGAPSKVVSAGTVPSVGAGYEQVTFNTASNVVNSKGGSVQDFIDSFALKIFQSPTDGELTEIQTRTVNANKVYEVRKTSDDSLATIYRDDSGTAEIVQDGTSNVSDSAGVIEFYVADGYYYVEVDSIQSNFEVDVLRQDLANPDKGAEMVAYEEGSVAQKLGRVASDARFVGYGLSSEQPVFEFKTGGRQILKTGPGGNVEERRPMLVIGYDDAHSSIYDTAWPIHKEEGVPGVFYVTGGYVEDGGGSRVTWDQLKEMHDYVGSGRIEIGNHTWDHQDLSLMDKDQVLFQVQRSNAEFAKHGIVTRHAAYPFNRNNQMVRSIYSNYFDSGRGSTDPEHIGVAGAGAIAHKGRMNPYQMVSMNSDRASMESFKEYIDAIMEHNAFGFLYLHGVVADTITLQSPDALREIIQYAKTVGVEIVTPDEVLMAHGPDSYYNRSGTEAYTTRDLQDLTLQQDDFNYLLLCEEKASDYFAWVGEIYLLSSANVNAYGAGAITLSVSRGLGGILNASIHGGFAGINSQEVKLYKVTYEGSVYLALHLRSSSGVDSVRVEEKMSHNGWHMQMLVKNQNTISDPIPFVTVENNTYPIAEEERGDFEYGTYIKRADGTLEYILSRQSPDVASGASNFVEFEWPVPFVGSGNFIHAIVATFGATSPSVSANVARAAVATQGIGRGSLSPFYSSARWEVVNNSSTVSLNSNVWLHARVVGRWRV